MFVLTARIVCSTCACGRSFGLRACLLRLCAVCSDGARCSLGLLLQHMQLPACARWFAYLGKGGRARSRCCAEAIRLRSKHARCSFGLQALLVRPTRVVCTCCSVCGPVHIPNLSGSLPDSSGLAMRARVPLALDFQISRQRPGWPDSGKSKVGPCACMVIWKCASN